MKGFYVSQKSKSHTKGPIVVKAETNSCIAEVVASEQLVASTGSNIPIKIIPNSILDLSDECNDILTMKNGDKLKVKVLEVGVDEILYKRCDNLDGPTIVVNKKEVFKIKYSNGSEEIIEQKAEINKKERINNNAPAVKLKTHPLASMSLFTGILTFIAFLYLLIMLAIALIVFSVLPFFDLIDVLKQIIIPLLLFSLTAITSITSGIFSLVKISREPNKYKGMGMAVAGIILSAISIIIFVSIIASI